MSDPVYIFDHVERALDNLTSDWADKPTMQSLVNIFVTEIQALEDVFYELIVERYLSSAVGSQLDQFGEVVGEPRGGLSDADYRGFIAARISTNLGEGEIWRLVEVIKTLTQASDVKYHAAYPASYVVDYVRAGYTTAEFRTRLSSQILSMTPAGVGLNIVEAQAGYFGFDDDPDSLGFGLGEFAEAIA